MVISDFITGYALGALIGLGQLFVLIRLMPLLGKKEIKTLDRDTMKPAVESGEEASDFITLAPVPQLTRSAPQPVYLPDEIVSYCEGESEQWAADECKAAAVEMFPVHGDWSRVLTDLAKNNNELGIG